MFFTTCLLTFGYTQNFISFRFPLFCAGNVMSDGIVGHPYTFYSSALYLITPSLPTLWSEHINQYDGKYFIEISVPL